MVTVNGHVVDEETRCVHYYSSKDIVAIRFRCCNKYYPCYQCHDACEDHERKVWGVDEFDQLAILCGVCRSEHTISQYLSIPHCPNCHSPFNEGCRTHHHLYFQVVEG